MGTRHIRCAKRWCAPPGHTVAYHLAPPRPREQAVIVAKLTNLRERLPSGAAEPVGVDPPGQAASDPVPAFRPDLVRRPSLVGRLAAASDRPLVVITAPAGYGKTTLLSEWAEQDTRPFVWLSLEHRRRARAPLAEMIAALTGVLVRAKPFVLVLDGAHLVRPRMLHDTIEGLLPELTPGAQVVLSGRREPSLALGRFRTRRQLIELGAGDLSMSPGEAAALLRATGLELEFATVQRLERITEGWPAGLYLAALSLLGHDDKAEALARFGGEDHLVAQYLEDEFLTDLSAEARTLLRSGSVLDHLSGPVCDEVLEREGSGALLAELARSNLPLAPLDAEHGSYRLHGLLRQSLQAELRRSDRGLAQRLHRRASAWCAKHDEADRAIEHAVAAGDANRAGKLLWAHLPRYLGAGRNETVQHWLACFTAEQIEGCAALALVMAHSHLAAGQLDSARQWSRVAGAAIERSPARARSGSLPAGVAIIQAWAARMGAGAMAEDATRAAELLPDHSPWRATCCFLRGSADLLRGNRVQARRHFEEGVDRGSVAAPDVAARCLAQLASIAIDDEEWESAEDLAERALKMTERHHLGDSPTSALAFAVSAAVGAHEGLIVEAKRDLRHCGDLLRELDRFAPWYGAETRILLARAAMALADVQDARARLAEASRLARRTPDVVIFRQWFDAAWDEADTRAETALIGPSSLTTAELRVLRFLPTHYSFREIAQRLHVSSNTVKTQVHAVYRKLDASSRSEAVANASRAGLLGT